MDDNEFDRILTRPRTKWSSSVSAAVDELIETTRHHTAPPVIARKRWSRGMVWGSVAVGATVLTAGASIAAVQLGIPPFQTLDKGLQRTSTSIPVDYVQTDGTAVRCLAFMEFQHLDGAAVTRVERFVSTHDWAGFGQALFDASPATATLFITPRISAGHLLDSALFGKAREALPGLIRGPSDTTAISYTGFSMSCSPQSE